jgi:hypothetical protein
MELVWIPSWDWPVVFRRGPPLVMSDSGQREGGSEETVSSVLWDSTSV